MKSMKLYYPNESAYNARPDHRVPLFFFKDQILQVKYFTQMIN